MWVFPGGQVDATDRAGASAPLDTAAEIAAARRAAVREAREEAGLELDEHSLATLSFWLPPADAERRFATWFFLAAVTGCDPVVVDLVEIHEGRWLRPAEAMAARNRGELLLAPPTFTTLWWVSQHDDAAGATRTAASRPPLRYFTRIVVGPGGQPLAAAWDGDAAYADGDLDRAGPRRRLWLAGSRWHMEMTDHWGS